MTTKEDKALAVWQDKYPALTINVAELLRESLGDNAKLSMGDLPTVKIPAGGAKNWELPTGEASSVLEGVLMVYQPVRAYWNDDFTGGGSPPDCSSDDDVTGLGMFGPGSELNQTGLCEKCPQSRFGSGKENSQACRLITRLFLLQPNALVPTMVPLPPSSYKAAREYVRDLAILYRVRPTAVLTRIKLVQDKSKTGIAYSKAEFEKPEALPGDVAMYMLSYREQIKDALLARGVSGEDIGDN